MAKEYQIKWKQTDYLNLGRAISNFNKKKNELERLEKYENVILPYTLNYQEVKERITTRKELNRYINALRKFGKGNSLEIYKTQMGDNILNWEHQELEKNKARIVKRLSERLIPFETPNNQGITRVQMGSTKYYKILNDIERFKNYETNKGYDFKQLRYVMQKIGTEDYSMRKAITFRKNYMNVMEKYQDFDNYETLKKKMEAIKNPIDFFKYFGKDDTSSDFDLTYQSEQFFAQQEFNRWLERLGIDINEDTIFSEERVNNI